MKQMNKRRSVFNSYRYKQLHIRFIPCSFHESHEPFPPEQEAMLVERGTSFMQGSAFYRPESSQGRDLAVLAAALHRRRTGGPLRVLDVMSASGGRGALVERACMHFRTFGATIG